MPQDPSRPEDDPLAGLDAWERRVGRDPMTRFLAGTRQGLGLCGVTISGALLQALGNAADNPWRGLGLALYAAGCALAVYRLNRAVVRCHRAGLPPDGGA